MAELRWPVGEVKRRSGSEFDCLPNGRLFKCDHVGLASFIEIILPQIEGC